jgi:hypothetical protein
MSDQLPTTEWALSIMDLAENEGGGLGGNCCGCLFAVGPVDRWGELIEAGQNQVGNEQRYKCTLPTRAPGAKLVDWGSRVTCTSGEWARWIAQQAAGEALRFQHIRDVAMLRDGERYSSWVAQQPYDEDLANDEPSRHQIADYLESTWHDRS